MKTMTTNASKYLAALSAMKLENIEYRETLSNNYIIKIIKYRKTKVLESITGNVKQNGCAEGVKAAAVADVHGRPTL
jgi:hypothetical protein